MNRLSVFLDPRTIPCPVDEDLLARWGGKASCLEVLRQSGFPVPEFAVIPVDRLTEFLTRHRLSLVNSPIDELRAAIEGKEFSPELTVELQGLWKRFSPDPICVRSSGTCEDLPDLSFAGQYETCLNITSFEAFIRAVRNCWASLFNTRVQEYFRQHHLPREKAGLALIVQRFLQADFAGVTFTIHPLTGRQNHLLMEYCPGGGEELVSGRLTPSTVVFDHSTETLVSGQLPEGMRPENLRDFRRLQVLFGSPQDVEWVLARGQFWIVQSRPVTRIKVDAGFGTWTTADFRDGGVSSSLVTPFMWSLYDYIWQHAMPGYFRILGLLTPGQDQKPWGGSFFGRPYWNLGEVISCLLKIPGFIEANLFSDLGIKTEPGYRYRVVPYSAERITAVLPTLLSLEHYYDWRIRENRKYRREFASFIGPFVQEPLGELTLPELARRFSDLIRRIYFQTETSYFFTIYNTSNAKLDFKVRLDAINDAGHDLSYIKLISGLLRVKHLGPLKGLAHMAQEILHHPEVRERVLSTPSSEIEAVLATTPEGRPILEKMESFLKEYGYHSTRELDISVARWNQDHTTVWRLLKTYLRDPDPESAITHEKRQHQIFRDEVTRAREAFSGWQHQVLPFERWLFFRALLRTRTYCWWREEMRDYSSRVYDVIRAYAMEAGIRLGLAEGEVFWLTWQELEDALHGRINGEEVRERLTLANEQALMFRNFDNPDELGAGFLGKEQASGTEPQSANALHGVGCSPGVCEGIARVIPNLEDVDRIRRGEILVTRFTDPGWTPIFHLIGGVVTETGGVLSHAAVISREYGIPAVLNVAGASRLIEDGQRIRIDGSTGQVTRL